MPSVTERRRSALRWGPEVRGSKGRQRWATAVTYNTGPDDYGTLWRPGCFRASLERQGPVVLWGHDWSSIDSVLGRVVDHRETTTGQDVLIGFADPSQVPASRKAMELVASGVITDVSVGFRRIRWHTRSELSASDRQAGAEEAILEADLDEISLVAKGAVKGAQFRRLPGDRQLERDLERELDEAMRLVRRMNREAELRRIVGLDSDDRTLDRDVDDVLQRLGYR